MTDAFIPLAGAGHNTLARRGLVAGVAFLTTGASAGVAAPISNPDAALIAVCAEFLEQERRIRVTFGGARTAEEEQRAAATLERITEQQRPLIAQICACSCTTQVGAAAIARCWMSWSGVRAADDPTDHAEDRLKAALLRAVLAGRA